MQQLVYVDYHTNGSSITSLDMGNAVTCYCYMPVSISYSGAYMYQSTIYGVPAAMYRTDITWYFTWEFLGLVVTSARAYVWGNVYGGEGGWLEPLSEGG